MIGFILASRERWHELLTGDQRREGGSDVHRQSCTFAPRPAPHRVPSSLAPPVRREPSPPSRGSSGRSGSSTRPRPSSAAFTCSPRAPRRRRTSTVRSSSTCATTRAWRASSTACGTRTRSRPSRARPRPLPPQRRRWRDGPDAHRDVRRAGRGRSGGGDGLGDDQPWRQARLLPGAGRGAANARGAGGSDRHGAAAGPRVARVAARRRLRRARRRVRSVRAAARARVRARAGGQPRVSDAGVRRDVGNLARRGAAGRVVPHRLRRRLARARLPPLLRHGGVLSQRLPRQSRRRAGSRRSAIGRPRSRPAGGSRTSAAVTALRRS